MSTIAETLCGPVEGQVEGGTCVFRGIPFAEPPVGDLRFRAPVGKEAWTGVRSAVDYGPIAPQVLGGTQVDYWGLEGESGEDCLSLNVWTPAVDGRRRPGLIKL